MARVLIVSNRLPMSVKKVDNKLEFYPSIGGVATGLASYVKDRKNIWVGWPGITSEEVTENEKQIITNRLAKLHCHPVFLTKRQVDDYYNGYSNSILWPAFHNLPAKSSPLEEQWWKAYRSVNKLFADTVMSLVHPDTSIWVHDYQLLLLPDILRAEHVSPHLGFFLHIPFPEYKTIQSVGHIKQLLLGMLGADLIGFHTVSYSENFIQACQEAGIGLAGQKQVILNIRNVQVTNFPIGIDYEKYAQSGKLRAVKQAVKQYRKKYGRRKIILAVDRLEPSKGLTERLNAFSEFLETNPRFRNKVIMVMVAAPSRMDLKPYKQLKIKLEKLSQEINQNYGTTSWQPVDFINESLPFEAVSALYQLADIAFIAPLRDGMNLVAKEYVASKKKNGILILSQTAGAAEELRDALIVDPKQQKTVTEALRLAMIMPRRELRHRLKNMQQQIAGNTIHTWAGSFVKSLQQPIPGTRPRTHSLKGKLLSNVLKTFREANKRLILLDYDGTLIPYVNDYTDTKPPKKIIQLLQRLIDNPKNEVVLVSGRQEHDLDDWFGSLKMHLVGEHGAVVKKAGAKKWRSYEYVNTEWKKSVLPVLEKYTAETPRAMIEIKPHSIVWHYRMSPSYNAQKNAVIIKRVLRPILKKYGIQIFQGNKILEIKDPRINKGAAIQRWLSSSHDVVLALGDDYTDEDLFQSLNETAYTIKVGSGRTFATYRLKTVAEVTNFLQLLHK